jgi:hypothetical protein
MNLSGFVINLKKNNIDLFSLDVINNNKILYTLTSVK